MWLNIGKIELLGRSPLIHAFFFEGESNNNIERNGTLDFQISCPTPRRASLRVYPCRLNKNVENKGSDSGGMRGGV